MTQRRRSWMMLALLPVWLMPVFTVSIRDHGATLRAMWPQWRVMIEQFTLIVAIICLVAAMVAGVVTWRRESRGHA